MHPSLTSVFARWAVFADPDVARAAQLTFLRRANEVEQHTLTDNEYLHRDAVVALIANKLRVEHARRLVANHVRNDLVASLLDHEHRDSVTVYAADHVTDATLALRLAGVGKQSASAVCAARHLDVDTRLGAARLQSSLAARARLGADMTDIVVLDDSEIIGWLNDASSWPSPKHTPRVALSRLLWRRPQLLASIGAKSNPSLVTVAAGSIAIVDRQARQQVLDAAVQLAATEEPFALLAAAANPRFDVEEVRAVLSKLHVAARQRVEESLKFRRFRPAVTARVADVEESQLNWLTRRAFPNDRSQTGRPAEIVELAAHPVLSDDPALTEALWTVHRYCPEYRPDAEYLLACKGATFDSDADVRDTPAHTVDPTALDVALRSCFRIDVATAFCDVASQRLGADESRWETLWALSGSFDGTVAELIDVAAAV